MRAIKAYTKSSSFVVSFFFIILLILGVGFNTYTLTVANDDLLIRETQAALQADLGGFRTLYNSAGRQAIINAVEQRLSSPTNDFLYYYRDNKGLSIAGNLAQWPSESVQLVKNGVLDIKANLLPEFGGQNQRQNKERAMAMVIEFSNGDSLLVARNVQDIEFAEALARTSSWVMIVVVFIVAATSLGVAYYVVSRINKIADTADDIITTGNLSDRLYVESQWDDLSKLTLVLNQLLDKIESSVSAISSVSDNIAHDLRTPLTRLKGHIEEVSDTKQKQQLLAECDNLLAIFNSLLRISDIENSTKKSAFAHFSYDELLNDAIDLYSPIIEGKNISLVAKINTDIEFFGDKDLIFQAVANVLDNAIKFTPENGKICIKLYQSEHHLNCIVDDSGKGVNKENLQKLTGRFYREDKSRTASGNGLGLALVNAIVSLHDGEVFFEQSHIENSVGLRCRFSFTRQ